MSQPSPGLNPHWPPGQQPPPYHAPDPTPRWKTRDWWTKGPGIGILVFAAGLVLIPIAALGGSDEPADDIRVRVTSCELGEGTGSVGLEVTNHGDRARTVRVEVEYRDGAGRRIDTDRATIRDVRPGDTVAHEELTVLNAPAGVGGGCRVLSVR